MVMPVFKAMPSGTAYWICPAGMFIHDIGKVTAEALAKAGLHTIGDLQDPVESAEDIYAIACSILRRERLVDRPLRLLGLGVTGLVPPSTQMILPL